MVAQMRPVALMEIRKERGMNKFELARTTRMQPGMIAWIEEGRFIPYPSQLEKLARALGVSDPGELLEVVDDGPTAA